MNVIALKSQPEGQIYDQSEVLDQVHPRSNLSEGNAAAALDRKKARENANI